MNDSNPSEPTPTPARLQLDHRFEPCIAEPGDELYPNGIFEFNITRLVAFVRGQPERFPVEHVALTEIPDYGGGGLDGAAIEAADLSRPILMAEIAPGRFNVIDGHHRLAKARREGLSGIAAQRVRCPDHLGFLTSARAYSTYVDYWNSKLKYSSRSQL